MQVDNTAEAAAVTKLTSSGHQARYRLDTAEAADQL
jgi:hypothetical protein